MKVVYADSDHIDLEIQPDLPVFRLHQSTLNQLVESLVELTNIVRCGRKFGTPANKVDYERYYHHLLRLIPELRYVNIESLMRIMRKLATGDAPKLCRSFKRGKTDAKVYSGRYWLPTQGGEVWDQAKGYIFRWSQEYLNMYYGKMLIEKGESIGCTAQAV